MSDVSNLKTHSYCTVSFVHVVVKYFVLCSNVFIGNTTHSNNIYECLTLLSSRVMLLLYLYVVANK